MLKGIRPDSKLFAKFDAKSGYFLILLDKDSSNLTTFLLPSGRYRYLRSPMGLSASSDEWCRRSDMFLEGLDLLKLVDDLLIQAQTHEEL